MTNHCIVRLGRAAVLVGIVTLCLAAPSAWAQKSAEKATEDREAFRGSVLVIRGQIDATLNALDGIVKGKDGGARKKALKNYSEEIKEMDKQIEKTRDYA